MEKDNDLYRITKIINNAVSNQTTVYELFGLWSFRCVYHEQDLYQLCKLKCSCHGLTVKGEVCLSQLLAWGEVPEITWKL